MSKVHYCQSDRYLVVIVHSNQQTNSVYFKFLKHRVRKDFEIWIADLVRRSLSEDIMYIDVFKFRPRSYSLTSYVHISNGVHVRSNLCPYKWRYINEKTKIIL